MSREPKSLQGWLRRPAAWCSAWLLRHGQRPYAIGSLSAVSVLDGVLPMMPAEFLALALMILQPRRIVLVTVAFAVSAAISAGLLAALVAGISQSVAWPGWLEAERQGAGWARAASLLQEWGAPALAAAAVFPDSPRASVAVAALVGLPPLQVAGFVLAGKLLLYGLLAWAVRYLPTRWPGRATASWLGARLVRRAMQRFAALRRWVDRRAAHDGARGEPSGR